MGHHIHHQHAPIAERDVATVVNVVYVTASTPDAPVAPVNAASSRQVGAPVQNTRPAALAAAPAAQTYSAPPRNQRPQQSYVAPPRNHSPQATYVAPPRNHRPQQSSVQPTAISGEDPIYAVSSAAPATSAPPATTRAAGHPVQHQSSSISGLINPYAVQSKEIAAGGVGVGSSGSASYNTAAPDATSTTPTSGAAVHKNTSLSAGASAGIGLAALLGVALLAGLGFFLYRRKQKENEKHQRLDDEKTALHKRSQSVASHVSVRHTKNNAPRLSLRPVTQMFDQPMSEKQGGNSLTMAGAAARSRTPEHGPRSASNDPFADDASDKSDLSTPSAAAVPTPVTAKLDSMSSGRTPSPENQSFPGAAGGPASRRNSPPGPGPNNVHRVQLDFKPSMDDELELRAGALVRMLHEYDDGWALCVRLDRSQQGVVPRTCISKLPVKPRPGPPPGQGARGPPPQGGRPQRPSNGPGPRMSPSGGPGRPMPPPGARVRSATNGPYRPDSPGAYSQRSSGGRARSNSDAMSSRRITPPSPMNPTNSAPSSPPQAQGGMPARKPVPGQAM